MADDSVNTCCYVPPTSTSNDVSMRGHDETQNMHCSLCTNNTSLHPQKPLNSMADDSVNTCCYVPPTSTSNDVSMCGHDETQNTHCSLCTNNTSLHPQKPLNSMADDSVNTCCYVPPTSTSNDVSMCGHDETQNMHCSLCTNNTSLHPQKPLNRDTFPVPYELPEFPTWVQRLLEMEAPASDSDMPILRKAIIKTLFDDLKRYDLFPSNRMYYEATTRLVECYPQLKDKDFSDAEPNESWSVRLRGKFKLYHSIPRKFWRSPNNEALQKQCESRGSRDHKEAPGLGHLIPAKRNNRNQEDELQDEPSIIVFIKILKKEMEKLVKHYKDVLTERTNTEFPDHESHKKLCEITKVLSQFPALQCQYQFELEADCLGIRVDDLKSFLLHYEEQIHFGVVGKKAKDLKARFTHLVNNEESLLLKSVMLLFIGLNEELPCQIVQHPYPIPCDDQPSILTTEGVLTATLFDICFDGILLCTTTDLLRALTFWFSMFWIFDLKYDVRHRLFLNFLDVGLYIFKKRSRKHIPLRVSALFNKL